MNDNATCCQSRARGAPENEQSEFLGLRYTEERSKSEIETRLCVAATRPSPVSRAEEIINNPRLSERNHTENERKQRDGFTKTYDR